MAPPYTIEIANSQTCLDIDEPFLHTVAQRTLAEEQVRSASVSIAVIDNAAIRELNRRFLDHDAATDVLSFVLDCEGPADSPDVVPASRPMQAEADAGTDAARGRGKRIDGEVIIGAEMARQTAEDYDWRPHDELVLYLVHGLLHLCGYDDLDDQEQRAMRERERTILGLWGLVPRYEGANHDHVGPESCHLEPRS